MKLRLVKQSFIAFALALSATTPLPAALQNRQTVIFSTRDTLPLINSIEKKHQVLSSLQATYKFLTDAPSLQSAAVYGVLGAGFSAALVKYWRSIGSGLYSATSSVFNALLATSNVPFSLTAGTCAGLSLFSYLYWQSTGIKTWRAAMAFKDVYRHANNDSLFMGNVSIENARGYISQRFDNNLDAAIAHYQKLALKMMTIQKFLVIGLQDSTLKIDCENLIREAKRYEVRLAAILTVLRNLETAERLRAVALNNPAAVHYQVSNPAA